MSAARTLLEQAVRLSPDKGAPRLALGAALKGLGEYAEALVVLKDAHQRSSNPSSVAMMIADCQVKLGQPQEALKSLRQALRRSRRPAVIHKRLGDLLTTLGKYAEAIEEYRAVVLNHPDLGEKQAELIALIDKAQAPGENPEPPAKQI